MGFLSPREVLTGGVAAALSQVAVFLSGSGVFFTGPSLMRNGLKGNLCT